ncbi:ATP-binding protein [Salinigranum sp. GCM10025319]|uniref:ATP-binding protein n=1 Tax=Salinigranum sp. GCM10025319 TaxID=3252687 RepID=UPI00361EDF17
MYVSDRAGRTETTGDGAREGVVTRAASTLGAGAEVPAAEWVVIDADVLGPTPPSWLDALTGEVYVLDRTDTSIPDWVTDAGLTVLDPTLVRLITNATTAVPVDVETVDPNDPDGIDTIDGIDEINEIDRSDGIDEINEIDGIDGTDGTDAGSSDPDGTAGSLGGGAGVDPTPVDPSDGLDSPAESAEIVGDGAVDGEGEDDERTDHTPSSLGPDTAIIGNGTVDSDVPDRIDSLSAIPFPVALLDSDGVIRLVNAAWREFGTLHGRSPDETDVGTSYVQICEDADDTFAASAAKAIRRVVEDDSDGEQVEYPCHSQRGKRWFSMDVVPVEGPGPVAAAVVHYEVSHYKQRINVLDRVLRHNLRNKANIILGHAAALASDRDDETATAATTIGAAARELLSLSEQARRYREASVEDRPTTPIDAVSVVSEVTERLSDRHPSAVIETTLPAVAVVRGTQSLSLVVHELVENAIVHNDRDKPWVRVEIVRVHEGGDERVSVRVVDDGPGIPEEDRRLLTGGLEDHPVRHGSQLGVWVVSSLVTSLDGKVTVEPRSPRGSVVTVTFPSVTVEE